ncbi:MAG: c-type cytochrome [Gemmatales bacterium]|nr:c-type cytochrome [Gemmatales bacterium]
MHSVRPCRWTLLGLLAALGLITPAWSQREYGFDNRKPTGQPYLSPQETVKRFRVADGWEVTLFAAEPDVVNPIAFTIDERGRVWVLECYEYPKRTPPGQMPRDRIKILEDTDGDGRADKVSLWAEGKNFPTRFDLASGLEVGYGGVFLGAPPYLFFLQDRNQDGQCDHYEILLRGFGSQDTHETLNTFQWGPDGRLYGLHGVFTTSEVQGVRLDAAVWRYDVVTKRFEVFAEGTSNPWGMDFDHEGNCFIVCCVIPHLFHIVPGGIYIKQSYKPSYHPYAYGQLREISDHLHHQESGWAHAGLLYLDGPTVPQALRGSLLMGSIHGSSIKRDVLRRKGSSFVASHAPDLVISGDRNVRPINLRWAPDGSIYWIDWHDQNPCHQADPNSWDYSRGRIYRLAPKGLAPQRPKDMALLSPRHLADAAVYEDNPYRYRTALRLLAERRSGLDAQTINYLRSIALDPKQGLRSLRALWALHALGALDQGTRHRLLGHPYPAVRAWSIRFIGEQPTWDDHDLKALAQLSTTENEAPVRLELACALRRITHPSALLVLQTLLLRKEDAQDPVIPFVLWLAWEAQLSRIIKTPSEKTAAELDRLLEHLAEHADNNLLIIREIIPRTMRRLLAEDPQPHLARCLNFVRQCTDDASKAAALSGILEALRNRPVPPPDNWSHLVAELDVSGKGELVNLVRELGVIFRDPRSVKAALTVLSSAKSSEADLLRALQALALLNPPEALVVLKRRWESDCSEALRIALLRNLGHYEDAQIANMLIQSWPKLSSTVRAEVIKTLQKRRMWARALLEAVARKEISPKELNSNTVLAIRAFQDEELNRFLDKVWGQVRETPAEIQKKIERFRQALFTGRADPQRGRLLYEKHCAQCHRFRNQGHEVGPDLDGAERSLDYLLINILDPNRVVGQPYFTYLILTKDGKVITGLLAAEDAQTITVRRENNVLETVQKTNIEDMKIETRSLMPENLDQNITEQEFRDLVSYLLASPFITEVYVSAPTRPDSAKLETWWKGTKRPVEDKSLAWETPAVGPAGRIPIPSAKYDLAGRDVSYVYAEVENEQAIKTELRLGSIVACRVWIDGKLVLQKSQPSKQAQIDELSVPVQFEPGRHRVLIEAVCLDRLGELYLRFHDPHAQIKQVPVTPVSAK